MKKSPSPLRIAKQYEHARRVWGHALQENFEKLEPKSCNLSELKVILLNWKKAVSIYTTVVQLILLGYSHDRRAANSP